MQRRLYGCVFVMSSFYLQPDLASDLENHILAHIFRNRMTMRRVVHRLFYRGRSVSAVSRRMSALIDRGYVCRHRLFAKRVYFTAGPRSVRRFRLSRNAARAIPKQRLAVELGSLVYCCGGEIVRKRLTRNELRQEYPWLPTGLVDVHPSYFDYDEKQRRLASLRVELSGSASYIVEKQNRELYKLSRNRRFRGLLEHDEFMLVTITTSRERREALINEIERQPWYPAARVVDYCELAHFL